MVLRKSENSICSLRVYSFYTICLLSKSEHSSSHALWAIIFFVASEMENNSLFCHRNVKGYD